MVYRLGLLLQTTERISLFGRSEKGFAKGGAMVSDCNYTIVITPKSFVCSKQMGVKEINRVSNGL